MGDVNTFRSDFQTSHGSLYVYSYLTNPHPIYS